MSEDLVKRLRAGTGGGKLWMDLHTEAADRIDQLVATNDELEAKLAKAVEALEYYNVHGYEGKEARTTLAELKENQ
jgi:hypothetical protein